LRAELVGGAALTADVTTRKIGVVGATGRVGRRVVEILDSRKDAAVVAFARSDEKLSGLLPRSNIERMVGDVRDDRALENLCNHVDAVIWVAGATGPQDSSAIVDEEAVKKCVSLLCDSHRTDVVFDFGAADVVSSFSPLDDVIMGGMSSSSMLPHSGYATFSGDVTTARNGGFCQSRNVLSAPADWTRAAGLLLKCRGDGRKYKINLKNSTEPEFVFQAEFVTSSSGEWEAIRIPFSDFVPVRRGNIVYGQGEKLYQTELDVSKIISVSFVISKVGIGVKKCPSFVPGSFNLDLKSMSLWESDLPKIVLLSSAGVTRPSWSAEKKRQFPREASMPIVKLNPGNILGHKLAGETAVRQNGCSYCIIRSTGLNDDYPSGDLEFGQGDLMSGKINREDIAFLLVEAAYSHHAAFKTFEVRGKPSLPRSEVEGMLRRLPIE